MPNPQRAENNFDQEARAGNDFQAPNRGNSFWQNHVPQVEDNPADFMQAVRNLHQIAYKSEQNIKDKDCTVCLMDYEEEDQLTILPDCFHAFHKDCIEEWFIKSKSCPVCRKEFT